MWPHDAADGYFWCRICWTGAKNTYLWQSRDTLTQDNILNILMYRLSVSSYTSHKTFFLNGQFFWSTRYLDATFTTVRPTVQSTLSAVNFNEIFATYFLRYKRFKICTGAPQNPSLWSKEFVIRNHEEKNIRQAICVYSLNVLNINERFDA